MSAAVQQKLVGSHIGRIILHIICVNKDHKLLWHLRGIMREIV